MNLIVFGASGATGKCLVEQSLVQGHRVVAFVRSPAKVTTAHEALQVAQGDVLDPESIKQAMPGCDAALSVLGHDKLQDVRVYSESAGAILAAMKACGVRRLIYTTSANAPDGIERNPFAEGLRSGILHDTYADMRRAEALIMQSDADWTIVRPSGLTDDPYTGQYRVGMKTLPENANLISRADVAAFILKCLQDTQYIHSAPFVGTRPGQGTPPQEH